MRAVKCKHNVLSFINALETRIFDLVEAAGCLDISKLNERDQHIAEEMHKKNVLKKVKNDNFIGYKTYSS